MAGRLEPHEVENLGRSAAMAPLPGDQVSRLLQTCRELYHERTELEELLAKLLPAWGGWRDVLNEISRQIG